MRTDHVREPRCISGRRRMVVVADPRPGRDRGEQPEIHEPVVFLPRPCSAVAALQVARGLDPGNRRGTVALPVRYAQKMRTRRACAELPCIHPIDKRQACGIRRAIGQGAGRTTSPRRARAWSSRSAGSAPPGWSRHPDAGFQRPATSRYRPAAAVGGHHDAPSDGQWRRAGSAESRPAGSRRRSGARPRAVLRAQVHPGHQRPQGLMERQCVVSLMGSPARSGCGGSRSPGARLVLPGWRRRTGRGAGGVRLAEPPPRRGRRPPQPAAPGPPPELDVHLPGPERPVRRRRGRALETSLEFRETRGEGERGPNTARRGQTAKALYPRDVRAGITRDTEERRPDLSCLLEAPAFPTAAAITSARRWRRARTKSSATLQRPG